MSQFSKDGKYYAHLSVDGKLKIWNTLSNSFEQEFTPDFHLTTPCTCLNFIEVQHITNNKGSTPKKKKRKLYDDFNSTPDIALGTTSGLLIVYSVSKAAIEYTINSETGQSINCLSVTEDNIYSGAEHTVLVWNLDRRKITDKWKAGDEKISSILALIDTNYVLTASKSIKLWDITTKEVLKTFTGHSSEVEYLAVLPHSEKISEYVLSGSKRDRILNCWSLSSSDKNALAGLLMEDVVTNISITMSVNGTTFIATTVRSGVVHVYEHILNGKRSKPIKPKTSIQVVSGLEEVVPLRIFGAVYKAKDTLCIGYGTENILVFESINICSFKKLQCLVRKNPATISANKQEQTSKVIAPVVNNEVHYLTPHKTNLSGSKRKSNLTTDIPMEQRLENLSINQNEDTSTPKTESHVQLLIQGLHSKDRNILKTVLYNKNEEIIKNTVKKLPVTALVPLIQELSGFIQGKTLSSQIGSIWLKQILQIHTALLMSNPELPQLIGSTLGSIESRLSLISPLNKLKGRIDLLLPQVSGHSNQDSQIDEKPLFIYQDKDPNDSDDGEEMQLDNMNSESENEWEEGNSGEEIVENNVESDSDN